MKVVVADDQTAVRDGLVTILDLMPGIEVVAAAADGARAVELVAEHDPDVVLMDLRMPRLDGVQATARIRELHPRTQVVVLTTYADDESVLDALAAGALGFLTKNASRDDIARALEAASAGHTQLGPEAHTTVVRAATAPRRRAGEPPPDGLTRREFEVLGLIAGGLSNREIAAKLYLTEATVKSHVHRIFMKTGSRDRPQAIAYAHRHGIE